MYSPPGLFKRRYLSGLDWLIGTLDYGMKQRTGAGNASELALVLKGSLDMDELERGLREFASAFPIINGQIKRHWITLAPYWSYDYKAEGRVTIERIAMNSPMLDTAHSSGLSGEACKLAADFVNHPFGAADEHIGFALISGADNTNILLMRFDHCILDARGAETFLTYAIEHISSKEVENPRDIAGQTPSYSDMGLTGWGKKFQSGQYLNRKFLALGASDPVRLPLPARRPRNETAEKVHPVRYALASLSSEQTSRIFELAEQRAGFLMEMPYMLGATVTAMSILLRENLKEKGEGNLVVPLSMDTRRSRKKAEEIFFNYTSFMFFQIDGGARIDMDKSIELIKSQMYEQTKEGFPQKVAEAGLPMRIAPFSVLDKLIDKFLGAGASTFSFSYVGRAGIGPKSVLGADVTNVFHLPRVPTPPGLGVFFSAGVEGRLNITVSWLEGIISESHAEILLSDIKSALLGSAEA